MSAAAAAAEATPKKGKKKLILIVVGVLVLVLLLAGAALAFLSFRQQPQDDDDEDAPVAAAQAASKEPHAFDPKHPPVFVALDTFTVNLADRESERFAQVGVTLELSDAKVEEQVKALMPVIRNNILMVLAHKTSDTVREEAGKRRLAAELRVQVLRPLGYDITVEELLEEAETAKKKRRGLPPLPVKAVHFSSFIVQ